MALFWHFLFSAVCSSDKKVILWMYHTQSGMDSKRTIPFLLPVMPSGFFRISGWIKIIPIVGERKVEQKMNEPKVFMDCYHGVFRDQDAFLSCLRRIGENSSWRRQKAKNLRLIPLAQGSELAEKMKVKYTDSGLDEDIITDTILNTGLLLKDRNEYYPIRSCAIKSILDRAGIQGNGLRRVEKNVYARILNDCLKVAQGEALIRFSVGKVSAVLSGDCNDYSILDMEELFHHAVEYLTDNFKGCQYLGGFYEHNMVSALWELTGEDELLKAYRDEIRMHGKSIGDMKPVVRITTSDTGSGGANIFPMLLSSKGSLTINLGSPLRLEHRHGNDIQEFDKQLNQLYGKFQQATGKLINLLQIDIVHPIGCMKNVMDKLKIPKKYQAEALELFQAQYDLDFCTAHDIYYGISEILYMLACDGEEGSRIAHMEENIARALAFNWAEYDIPETF